MAEAKPETSDDDKIVIAKDGKLNPGGSAGMLTLILHWSLHLFQ